MIRFTREISVYVTAETGFAQRTWVRRFTELFGAATTVVGVGVWEGVEEPVVIVSHLFAAQMPDFDRFKLGQLVLQYKREAEQDAVLVVEREVDGKLF